MMSKAELEVLVEKYEGKANRAFRNFQETGISRYDRERRNAEELAGAIRMAVRASDDYTTMIHLRADLAEAAHLARAARMESEEKRQEAMEKALETVERMAARRGILRGE